MEIKKTAVSEVAARNIKLELVDQDIRKNALAIKAGIPSTTFDRKLNNPGQFTLKELGSIAEALDLRFEDLFKGTA